MTTSVPFRAFNEDGEIRTYYHGILPHWRQADCTYFVTYRLADALPQSVLREFHYERDQWLLHRGIDLTRTETEQVNWKNTIGRLSKVEQRLYERMMAMTLNRYLDAGYGSCVLRRPQHASIVAKSLEHFHGERILTGDYVVMPNHVHVLMRPLAKFKLEDVLQSIKSFTANEINRRIGKQGRFWMRESYDHIVRDQEQLEAFQRYIHANPAKANLKPNEYRLQARVYHLEE